MAQTILGTIGTATMTATDYVQQYIDEFLAAVEPLKDAYSNDSFSYLSVKTPDGLVLIQGTLFLNIQAPTIPFKTFESGKVQAGHFYLRDVGLSREQVLAELRAGKLRFPNGELLFPSNPGSQQLGAQFQPYHEIGLRTNSRLIHLALLGAETRHYIQQPNLDWELRAASTPYDGIQDLLNEFHPGLLRGVNCVEVAAFSVVAIDTESIVNGETAKLAVRSALTTDPKKIRVGVRVIEQGRVVRRVQLAGESFKWEDKEGFKRGETTLQVPRAGVVHASATYNDVTQQHYFFGDPSSFQNPRRAAYEAFDPKLSNLAEILTRSRDTRPAQHDFEAAMPWLFWMLGFSPAHIGGLPRTSDAADFLMASPSGNIAVVECTVGLLKEDHKLPKLHDRVQAVRRNLDTPSMRHVRVLPVMITAKLSEEVRPDLEQAEKLGIYVVTREGIDRLLQQTLSPSNADQLYEQAEQSTRVAKEARELREAQPLLPLIDGTEETEA